MLSNFRTAISSLLTRPRCCRFFNNNQEFSCQPLWGQLKSERCCRLFTPLLRTTMSSLVTRGRCCRNLKVTEKHPSDRSLLLYSKEGDAVDFDKFAKTTHIQPFLGQLNRGRCCRILKVTEKSTLLIDRFFSIPERAMLSIWTSSRKPHISNHFLASSKGGDAVEFSNGHFFSTHKAAMLSILQ